MKVFKVCKSEKQAVSEKTTNLEGATFDILKYGVHAENEPELEQVGTF